MAEISLVASIFGVASFGTKVATSLYQAADIMIHAHQQIASMAKHVSQFTAVLRHLGRVLETEKGSCSKDLLRQIKKIRRSCKQTFKEIHATIKSKRYRSFVPVRWLFKNSKAKELEARLDSEQSMLQVMIQTVTVSKLGDMHSKAKEDSTQISGLKDEISALKTLIIENHNNVTELQHAEQCAEAEALRDPPSPQPVLVERLSKPGNQDGRGPSRSTHLPPDMSPKASNESTASDSSESDDEEPAPETESETSKRTKSPQRKSTAKARSSDPNKAGKSWTSAVQPLSNFPKIMVYEQPRASSLLLQMIPYRPRMSHGVQRKSSDFLLGGGTDETNAPDTDSKPMMEEVTKSVRLLLDKWTTSGSEPVSDVLAEASKDSQHDSRDWPGYGPEESHLQGRPPPPPRPMFADDYSDLDWDDTGSRYPWVRAIPRPRILGSHAHHPMQGTPIRLNVWRSSASYQSRRVGDDILEALRRERGGIVYLMQRDLYIVLCVDDVAFYRINLVPEETIFEEATKTLSIEIGRSWVRQEALDLLGYSYSVTKSGDFSITGNLDFGEIEELVRLSYQGLYRSLVDQSKQIIETGGLKDYVRREERRASFERLDRRRKSDVRARSPVDGYGYNMYSDDNLSWDRDVFDRPAPPAPPRPSDAEYGKPATTNEKRKSAPAEVRFTLPRLSSNGHAPAPPFIPMSNPNVVEVETREGIQKRLQEEEALQAKKERLKHLTLEQELYEAEEKLKSLIKRKDEAIQARNLDLASDLQFYVIPDTEARIKALKQAQTKEANPSAASKQSRPPPTVAETDSESSEESEA